MRTKVAQTYADKVSEVLFSRTSLTNFTMVLQLIAYLDKTLPFPAMYMQIALKRELSGKRTYSFHPETYGEVKEYLQLLESENLLDEKAKSFINEIHETYVKYK